MKQYQLCDNRVMRWQFPLPRPHTGVPLGNGVQGILIWGEGTLNLTIGRAGFWDRRFGNKFESKITFDRLKELLQAEEHDAVAEAFGFGKSTGKPKGRPHQVGGGRLVLTFPDGLRPNSAELELETGQCKVTLADASEQQTHEIIIIQADQQELTALELPEALRGKVDIQLLPSWHWVGEQLEKIDCVPPDAWRSEEGGRACCIFTQHLPEDEPLTVAACSQRERIAIATALGHDCRDKARDLACGSDQTPDRISHTEKRQYWQQVPTVKLPDPILQEAFDFGLYKQEALTPPQGLACTLQGPWLEDYQLPPWSCDYHFNINIQMIYWPALASGCFDHFTPLWNMLKGWKDQLQATGEAFFKQPGAMLLPHAVDDRCQVVGQFWTGSIDHACTAWMTQLAWLHYRYSMDQSVLEEVAWPLMRGAFEGYWAMLERVKDEQGQERWSLPVSVSPEFRGSRWDAWGRDASFQLAACHWVASALPEAAMILGQELDERWASVSRELPPYTIVGRPYTIEYPEKQVEGIGLWEGMDLIESHRHHSHLGCLFPFQTVDPYADEHRAIVSASLSHWVREGMGAWSGWSMPWASILNARTGNADGAVAALHHWHTNFVNEGGGSLHDSFHPGMTNLSLGFLGQEGNRFAKQEIMQADAAMGALAAVYELLVQCRQGVIHILPALPTGWLDLAFDRVRAEGACQVGAMVKHGRVVEVRFEALKEGQFKIAHGLGNRAQLDGQVIEGEVWQGKVQVGQRMVFTPA